MYKTLYEWRLSAMLRPLWVLFLFGGYKLTRRKTKTGTVVAFFFGGPQSLGERAGGRAPDRTTLPAFTPGGAALT
ncbi:hypothetical protein ACVGWU_03075, partial [Enterobacter intestinihominis]